MRVATTYDNGNIFMHFGRSEQFKIYDIQDGKVLNEQVVGTGGTGHGALAGLLANGGVDTLICGGIGGGDHEHTHEHGESCGCHGHHDHDGHEGCGCH